MGYIATEKEYGDYHLRFQYRWGTKKFKPRYALKRDAGLYYHLTGPDAVWPTALQFQIEETVAGDLLALYEASRSIPGSTRRPAKRSSADLSRPEARHEDAASLGGRGIGYQKRLPGDLELPGWNTVEIITHGDTTVHLLNGHVVNQGQKIRYRDPKADGATQPGRSLKAGSPWKSRRPRSIFATWKFVSKRIRPSDPTLREDSFSSHPARLFFHPSSFILSFGEATSRGRCWLP